MWTTLRELAPAHRRVGAISQGPLLNVPLDELWRDFCSGRWSVLDEGATADRCYVCLTEREPARRRALNPKVVEILSRLARGECQKQIAWDLGLATSSVAVFARRALESLGISGRMPLVLTIAAHASAGSTGLNSGVLSAIAHPETIMVQTTRPDLILSGVLPPAQYAVARLLCAGNSAARIARERGTSERTVANQVARIFRALGVNGRSELISMLIRKAETHDESMSALPVSARGHERFERRIVS